MIVYLIRHGEITQFSPRRFVGQTDLPLTDRGRAQMAAVGRFLVGRGGVRLLCSSLSRCVDSAAIIGEAVGLVAEPVSELRELSLGAWEGLTVAEVQQRFPGDYEARGRDLVGFRPPDGESFADVWRRARGVFARVLGESADVVIIVAHGGLNRTLLCHVLGLPLEHLFRLEQDYAGINVLQGDTDGMAVRMMNFRLDC